MLSRRSFLWLTGAAGLSAAPLSAQRGRGGEAPAGPVPPSIAALTSMRSLAKPITADERRARLEKARRLMTEQKIDAIILAGGTSLNYFTGIRWGNSERLTAVVIPKVGNPYIVTPGVRGRSHARTARRRTGRAHRRRDLAGGREPVRTGRDRPQGARHRLGPDRHRGDVEVRLRRQHRRRRAGDEDRQRHADRRRLPHDQERARARSDARRVAGDAEVLRGGLQGAEAGHDAERRQQPDRRRLRAPRLSRLRQHPGRRVHRAAARIDHAADDPRRHDHHDRRWLHGGRLSVGHHAHVRARQGDRQDEEGVRHRPPGADGGAQGGAPRRAARVDRRGRPQGRRRQRLRARASSTSPTASATAWAWTATSGRTW